MFSSKIGAPWSAFTSLLLSMSIKLHGLPLAISFVINRVCSNMLLLASQSLDAPPGNSNLFETFNPAFRLNDQELNDLDNVENYADDEVERVDMSHDFPNSITPKKNPEPLIRKSRPLTSATGATRGLGDG
jgi:hypothetical protein